MVKFLKWACPKLRIPSRNTLIRRIVAREEMMTAHLIRQVYSFLFVAHWKVYCPDKKENQIFLIYKVIRSESVAKSRKSFKLLYSVIYEEMRKYLPIYEEAVGHMWLCNCSTLNFLIYEENLIFFLSVCTCTYLSIDCMLTNVLKLIKLLTTEFLSTGCWRMSHGLPQLRTAGLPTTNHFWPWPFTGYAPKPAPGWGQFWPASGL